MIGALVSNEMVKLLRRRRFRAAILILAAVTGLVVFARWKTQERDRAAAGVSAPKDWRAATQRRIVGLANQLRRPEIPPSYRQWMRAEVARLQYCLDHGFDPTALSGPSLSRLLAGSYSFLFVPLLVVLLGADIVSAEVAEGTINLLLVRPARRSKILAAKAAALAAASTLVVASCALLAWLFGGFAFGWRGWGMPVPAGFRFDAAGNLDVSMVRQLPLWRDALAAYGLLWCGALAVAALTLLCSVLFRSTAAAMGTLLGALVAGTILPRLASGWELSKYFFVTNLPMPDYYGGSPPPIPGMTLAFSAGNLALWSAAALAVAFAVFGRRDVAGG